MNRKQVADLLEKIQAYRQSFLITDTLIKEWSNILVDYDYEDVNKKLDEFFQNGENFGKYPDVYYLIKFLKKKEEKLKSGVEYLRCRFCGKVVELADYNQHYERCSSAEYLISMSKKYFDKSLNREKLLSCSLSEFEDYYLKFCEKLYEVIEDGLQKHVLKNVILTHSGYAPECDLKELQKR